MTSNPWPVIALDGAKRKLPEKADKQLSQKNQLVGESSKFPDRKE